MRRRGRIDANQPAIVRDLRRIGASVLSMSELGDGAPDLLVGWQGKNYAFEVKDSMKPPSARKLTDDERVFHALWRGQVQVIESTEEILKVLHG